MALNTLLNKEFPLHQYIGPFMSNKKNGHFLGYAGQGTADCHHADYFTRFLFNTFLYSSSIDYIIIVVAINNVFTRHWTVET